MNSQNKISLTLVAVMFAFFIIMLINITLNFRTYGLQSIEQKAHSVAQTIKHSLTSHMINGVIDKRDIFLDEIQNLENIDKLWLVRSQSVIDQYGPGHNNELAQDEIDKKVLASGQSIKDIKEEFLGKNTFRITIPYNAQKIGAIDCTSCHTAKVGETLGAITMVMDMNDLKKSGFDTMWHTALIAFILILVILYFVNRIIGPYMKTFDSIKHVMEKARQGDYTDRVRKTSNTHSQEVSTSINTFLTKLQDSLVDINTKVDDFLTHSKTINEDPLLEVKSSVSRLSDIYRFRNTIEHDQSMEEVYNRLANVLTTKFKLNDFNFIEADTTKKEIKVVYIHKKLHCDAQEGCRADRTNTMIDSCQFDNVCDKVINKEIHHLCIPYSVSNDLDFILNMNFDTPKELSNARDILPLINDYIDAAKPEIVSKKLMQILEKTARTDPLTGLYNRKFLEESIDKIVQQSKRTNISYGVLMVDIDFFKMINDTYGHDIGDEAIKIIANTLLENTRDSDFVIRYGGEEFIVLLYNCDQEYVSQISEKIRIAFSQRKINAGTHTFSKTISIGASIFPDTSDSFWKCIKYADMALYEAKSTGRNKVVVFDESLLKEDAEVEGDPY
ncbi:MAG: diguanylate cyclase [Campylobacterota bacterium]|nr:diguanylate cyclase [Campylobacterota bacterium]